MASPVFVTSDEVKKVLNWPLVNESVEEALKSVLSKEKLSEDTPFACQNARTFTQMHKNGVMLSMPGYVGNHTVTVDGVAKKLNTLACKLVTSVKTNEQLTPPMPSILANIMLLDAETGQLQCVMDGTQITAWRTGSASIVATKYLLFPRVSTDISAGISLAIVGCGVQGRIHAIGMCSVFNVKEVCLWNRTASKAEQLATELEASKDQFINQDVKVKVLETVGECVGNADVVVTATYAKEPVIHLGMLKKDVHINAIGAGAVHYSELSQDIYDVASVYVDHWAGAHSELKGLKTNIVCELGEVIVGKQFPAKGVTVFQSMGMAVEDATVAQAIFQHIKK